MTPRRVFVIWRHPLFLESVRRLLVDPRIEWIGANSDHAAARAQVVSLRPDTILVEEADDDAVHANVIELLEAASSDSRVFRLSLAENQLSVFHREQRTVGEAGDLLRMVLA